MFMTYDPGRMIPMAVLRSFGRPAPIDGEMSITSVPSPGAGDSSPSTRGVFRKNPALFHVK